MKSKNIRTKLGRPELPKEEVRAVVPIRFSALELEKIREAARKADKPLSAWIRETCNQAAESKPAPSK
jgi:hypothetical protein